MKTVRITGTLHEDLSKFMIISRSVLFRMRNVLNKAVEKVKTPILCSITFFSETRTVYEIMWKKIL
jgi:hypothetical protein